MLSPRPVPPYRRSVVGSTCVKRSKIADCRSRGMPMPVSRTAMATRICDGARPANGHLDLTSPLLGELHGIAGQVQEHLADAQRVAPEHLGQVRGDDGDDA